jgi:hypothetical protein
MISLFDYVALFLISYFMSFYYYINHVVLHVSFLFIRIPRRELAN